MKLPVRTAALWRAALAIAVVLSLGACASEFKPLEFPPPVPLQDPEPGRAVLYLLRVPDDPAAVTVYLDRVPVAVMPRDTHTVVHLSPGRHELVAVATADPQRVVGENDFPMAIEMTAGERRFVYTTQPTHSTSSLALVPGGQQGSLPLPVARKSPAGARAWRECNELDAQGLLSISRPLAPVRSSP